MAREQQKPYSQLDIQNLKLKTIYYLDMTKAYVYENRNIILHNHYNQPGKCLFSTFLNQPIARAHVFVTETLFRIKLTR